MDFLEKIKEEWKKDSIIDIGLLSQESLNIPVLHNKYYKILLNAKEALRKPLIEQRKFERTMILYYRGLLNTNQLKEMNLSPNLLKIKAGDEKKVIQTLDRYIELEEQIEKYEVIIEYLISILKQISERGFQIKNAIDFEKFKNGLM